MVVLENGANMIIQDSTGDRVQFESFEDFTKYTGYVLTNKIYIGYEPEIDFFQDSEDDTISNADIPNEFYETLISNIALYKTRLDDIFYGMTDQESKDFAIIQKLFEIDVSVATAFEAPYLHSDGRTYYSNSRDQDFISKSVSRGKPESMTWKTADKEANGVDNVYVSLNPVALKDLADGMFDAKVLAWGTGDYHKKQVKILYLDTLSSHLDIMAYIVPF